MPKVTYRVASGFKHVSDPQKLIEHLVNTLGYLKAKKSLEKTYGISLFLEPYGFSVLAVAEYKRNKRCSFIYNTENFK